MKKIACALAAFSALAVALPAAAQPYGGYGHGPGYGHGLGYGYGDRGIYSEIQQLDNRVDRSCARRVLSRSECYRLQGQVSWLRSSYRNAMRDGRMSRWERRNLQNSIYRVQASLRHERRDGDYGRHY